MNIDSQTNPQAKHHRSVLLQGTANSTRVTTHLTIKTKPRVSLNSTCLKGFKVNGANSKRQPAIQRKGPIPIEGLVIFATVGSLAGLLGPIDGLGPALREGDGLGPALREGETGIVTTLVLSLAVVLLLVTLSAVGHPTGHTH